MIGELVLGLELSTPEWWPGGWQGRQPRRDSSVPGCPFRPDSASPRTRTGAPVGPAGLEEVHARWPRPRRMTLTPAPGWRPGRGTCILARWTFRRRLPRPSGTPMRRWGRDVPVAVRSSATAEDLPFASFAGQQDTLPQRGGRRRRAGRRPGVLGLALDRPGRELPGHAAGSTPRTVALAVVVQRMVDAAVAGVLFTANPVTGRRHEAVIDASPGLGEAVVSGAVNPDHFVVDSARGAGAGAPAGRQTHAHPARPGRRHRRGATAGAGREPCLSDAQLPALCALGERVEAHYGSPAGHGVGHRRRGQAAG